MSETKNSTPPENIPVALPKRRSFAGIEPGSLRGTRMDYTPAPIVDPFDGVREAKNLPSKEFAAWLRKGNNRQLLEEYERSKT
jgi:hypothetical protein